MLQNAYLVLLSNFRFDTAENEPAKSLQIFAEPWKMLPNSAAVRGTRHGREADEARRARAHRGDEAEGHARGEAGQEEHHGELPADVLVALEVREGEGLRDRREVRREHVLCREQRKHVQERELQNSLLTFKGRHSSPRASTRPS